VGNKQYYLQNYAERDWWEGLPERSGLKAKMGLEGKIVIGWGGSISHLDSFWGSGVYEALTRICNRYPNVVIKICGNDDRLTQGLDGVSSKQIVRQLGVPPEEWPKQVRSFDIGLAPLFGFYDQHRSWIKGIEYLLAGVPWVGTSPGGPHGTYADLTGLGYLIQNSVREWEDTLTKIIDNLEQEQAKAEAFIPAAQEQFIVDYNLDVYAAVYRKIIEDFKRNGAGGGGLLPEVAHVG
jgi:glycosyltransferase involved in cell wall biosynthesis